MRQIPLHTYETYQSKKLFARFRQTCIGFVAESHLTRFRAAQWSAFAYDLTQKSMESFHAFGQRCCYGVGLTTTLNV